MTTFAPEVVMRLQNGNTYVYMGGRRESQDKWMSGVRNSCEGSRQWASHCSHDLSRSHHWVEVLEHAITEHFSLHEHSLHLKDVFVVEQ